MTTVWVDAGLMSTPQAGSKRGWSFYKGRILERVHEPMTSTMALSGCESRSAEGPRAQLAVVFETLQQSLSESVAIWSGTNGELRMASDGGLRLDEDFLSCLMRAVAADGKPQFVAEFGPICLLAVPVLLDHGVTEVATAPFLIGTLRPEDVAQAARRFGVSEYHLRDWAAKQSIWTSAALLKFASAVQAQFAAEARACQAEREIDLVSENIASTYEEISLLYTVTKSLKISSTDEELGRLAIERLEECLPAKAFAIQYLPVTTEDDETNKCRSRPLFLTSGDCPVDEQEFADLVRYLEINPAGGACVVNNRASQDATWNFPAVQQAVVVPLVEGNNVFGWIAAFNHRRNGSFGTVESNLLASLGTLLGIHCGNRELYRQQSELLRNIIRALVSAIDAKDPYTSGHSDRVARFAVRIALEMRCNPKFVNTVYMAGLLHDVGKIGVDDNVLRKAGRLTEAEFEHIKRHPVLGHKILADLKQLADVLPAVLHHHEQWDGHGYPEGLAGTQIPAIARIMAVADAYDAMTSDRPYRHGMPDEMVNQIFREGSGKFWDPEVVAAFFNAQDDIHAIAQRERPQVESLQQQFV